MGLQADLSRLSHAIIDDKSRGVFRVNRAAFVDPWILELERRQIFDRCWLYMGHVSEVAEPTSFVARKVAGRPLLMVRDKQGVLRVFYNSCTHRGALVCRESTGKTRAFTCPYHGWAFADDGHLLGQPLAE